MSLGVYSRKFNEKTQTVELVTGAKLVSISQNPLTNKNKTVYYLCNVEIIDMKGQEQTITAVLYQGNLDRANEQGGMKVGEMYSLTIVPPTSKEQGPLVKLSHLASSAGRATADMFDFGDESVPSAQPATAQKVEFVGDDKLPF